MKLLHLADLHLGRLFHEQSLIEDQHYVLNQVLDILGADQYRALILAGDIYDRSIPSVEAVSLFGSFLNMLHSRFPDLAVCMIAGNHDSPDRLAFGRELFQSMNIHIVSDPNLAFNPILLDDGQERCAIFLLPFLYPGSLERTRTDTEAHQKDAPTAEGQEAEPRGLRTQKELVAEASMRLESARRALENQGIHQSVLVAHLFTQGGTESESERLFIGTAEQVDVSQFAGFSYVALGHLHRCQKVRSQENAWYAGSPLAYSFGEADQEKVCLSVELTGNPATENPATVRVTPIPLQPLHPVRRIEASFTELMQAPVNTELAKSYLEVELTDEHLVENVQRILEHRYPLILSVKQNRGFRTLLTERAAMQGALPQGLGAGTERRRSTLDDFKAFEETLYGSVDQGKLNLFTTLLEQCRHETL
ncbi:exonuclease SbcCD subunit D [Gracilinema caldarium]|uniref:Nuclease SbcCD subunit D n=1 Tax=Gracilinema caldarium (strain ATCC 51460 / DSM 7334 / H1) TaxID=744872 RepID=F8F403_GRAC1|nr:exonuclease SbcCD subunit D [Gracilinema caldarium]AEJ20022.1 nuclease SbcCD, D subunit [Gracilinema caldarium DSM 7334]